MSRLEDKARRDERRLAWSDAKLAVRSYAHDPSDANAGRVNQAWRKVRRVMSTTIDRRMRHEPNGTSSDHRIQRP